ncbi:MAG: ribosome maturation factor RimP [Proteobacteria bacterium]|nr:ribosome maturation factor RimP [Pseudomonadota bacterium]
MAEVNVIARVKALIAPAIEAMGFSLVRVILSGGHNPTLQVMAEPTDGRGMTVDDCAAISRAVSAVLDVEEPIKSAYMLEVSSPGLDRPLTRLEDFERFKGFEASIETNAVVDGRRRFRGRLVGIDGKDIEVDIDGELLRLAFADVARAKLIVTDEMLAKLEREKAS